MCKAALKDVREVLFPNDLTCDLCGRETFGGNICEDCAKTLILNDKTVCPVCGRRTVRSEICIECKEKPPVFNRAASAFVYDGGAVELIKMFKNGKAYLKEYFADKICEKLTNPEYDCIVCVPLTRRAVRKRGYNQGELLAKAVSARLGVPVIKNALIKSSETAEQKELSREERRSNLKGCFKVAEKKAVKGKNVLIVDDVLTTGATSDEISKTLLKAGADNVFLATVASVEYKIFKTETS